MILSDRTEPRTELWKGQIASYTKQNASAQLPFDTRLDPLKLARDSLNIIAESPRDHWHVIIIIIDNFCIVLFSGVPKLKLSQSNYILLL